MIQLSDWAGDWLATFDNSVRWHARQLARRPEVFPATTEDLQQDLLLELHRQRPRFDPERSSLSTYGARVLRNKSVEIIRTAQAVKRLHSREPGGFEIAEQVGYEDDDRRDLNIDVQQFLADLPSDLKPLAVLLQTLTQKDAGRQLGLSRRQMAKQMKRLREIGDGQSLHVYVQQSSRKMRESDG